MICEQCQKEGKKSTIRFEADPSEVRLPTDYFYDEEGRFHAHDPNQDITLFTCSNGHTWTECDPAAKCQACESADSIAA